MRHAEHCARLARIYGGGARVPRRAEADKTFATTGPRLDGRLAGIGLNDGEGEKKKKRKKRGREEWERGNNATVVDRRCFPLYLSICLSICLSLSLCCFFLRDFPRRASADKAIAIGGRPDGGMVKYAGELCTAVLEVSTLREWAAFFPR